MKLNILKYTVLLLIIVCFINCDTSVSTITNDDTDPDVVWLVNPVLDGGVGQDGIVSIDDPITINSIEADFMTDDLLVIGVIIEGNARAYPHVILDWHEIANDKIGTTPFTITYCPLTGTAIAWNRILKNVETTFGVSGLLHNSNLIPYDRLTNTNWSQMLNKGVNGELIEFEIESYPVIETTWGTWKKMYPQTDILSFNQNIAGPQNYEVSPYPEYTYNSSLLFPINNDDSRLHRKERVVGVNFFDMTKAYPISSFGEGVKILNDTVGATDVVVVGSSTDNFGMIYNRTLEDGTLLSFTAENNKLPVVMLDNEGNKWDINGVAVSGPRSGEKLIHPNSFIGYWFAWGAFYPGLELYVDENNK